VREQIISGHYRPGAVIVESELASALQVSRTPVSNAIIMLKERGLVEERNGRFVTLDLTISDVIDLYQCRLAFDGLAAQLAAHRITESQLAQLESLLDAWEQPTEGVDSHSLWVADLSFHEALYAASQNRHLIRFSEIASDLLSTYRRVILTNLGSSRTPDRTQMDVRDEHEGIFLALKRRDAEGAEALARNHVANVIAYLETVRSSYLPVMEGEDAL
jgi:DNA-binding GntR family transcriptional regulator